MQIERFRSRFRVRSTYLSTSAGEEMNSELARIVWRTKEVSAAASTPPPVGGRGRIAPKLTSPSPSIVPYRGGRASVDSAVCPDFDAFLADLTSTYREQVRTTAELRCRYHQFDDTGLAHLNDPRQREQMMRLSRRWRSSA